jgi:hypothetical protein
MVWEVITKLTLHTLMHTLTFQTLLFSIKDIVQIG